MKLLSLESLLFSVLMSTTMSGVMTIVFVLREVQANQKILTLWLQQWPAALYVALPVGLVTAIILSKIFQVMKRFRA